MKLSYRQIEPFVKNPDPAARAILVYGPDAGLMKERVTTIGQTVTPDMNDPFNVAVLDAGDLAEDPARLFDEAASVSMMGGDRLIRIENGADKLTVLIKDYLEKPSDSALVLIEAGELGPRSSLRQLCEKAPNAAAVPCYVEDERDMMRLVRETLQAEGLEAEADAVHWLASSITGDRLRARGELEKLVTYKGGDKTPLTLPEARAVCGGAGAQGLDDLVFAVGSRNGPRALNAYQVLNEEGTALIAILRALQNHFRRLHLAQSYIADGLETEQAMKKLTPPVFFKQQNEFKAQLQRWPLAALQKVLTRLSSLEAQTKQTGMPGEIITAQVLVGLAAAGR